MPAIWFLQSSIFVCSSRLSKSLFWTVTLFVEPNLTGGTIPVGWVISESPSIFYFVVYYSLDTGSSLILIVSISGSSSGLSSNSNVN